MSQAIQPIQTNQNRKERRGFLREAKKIEPYIADVETKFEVALFNAPANLTYQDLYDYFQDKWMDLTKHLMLEHNLKYAAVDVHHFARKYRPYWRNLKK